MKLISRFWPALTELYAPGGVFETVPTWRRPTTKDISDQILLEVDIRNHPETYGTTTLKRLRQEFGEDYVRGLQILARAMETVASYEDDPPGPALWL